MSMMSIRSIWIVKWEVQVCADVAINNQSMTTSSRVEAVAEQMEYVNQS